MTWNISKCLKLQQAFLLKFQDVSTPDQIQLSRDDNDCHANIQQLTCQYETGFRYDTMQRIWQFNDSTSFFNSGLLANSAITKCRPFQAKLNCSKFIIDGLQQRCHMTLLQSHKKYP